MITIKGKREAKVMLPSYNDIDPETYKQIMTFCCNDYFDGNIVIMPDCHAGKGSCIGFTMPLNSWVIPNVVGVDIGCGVHAVKLPIHANDVNDEFCKKLDNVIRKKVPSGFNVHDDGPHNTKTVERDLIDRIMEVSSRVGQTQRKARESIGTLGGGNHFIELDVNDSTGVTYGWWSILDPGI